MMRLKKYYSQSIQRIVRKFTKIWYDPKLTVIGWLLLPFSGVFYWLSRLRYNAYCRGLFKVWRCSLPVIVIGNITVGGTGKTPFILYLANFLRTKGYHPVIISRGYGGKVKGVCLVNQASDPKEVGDEALLLARRTNCDVIVSRWRVSALQWLQCREKNQPYAHVDVVLSDDGLQHYAMARDIEIAVVDGRRQFGNGCYLPAGPLREPISRLQSVTAVVGRDVAKPGQFLMKVLPDHYCYHIQTGVKKLTTDMIQQTGNTSLHAIAGIAYPERFFAMLRQLGFNHIEEHPFLDHHFFSRNDIYFDDDQLVLMTEKDAVKCLAIADHRHWYLPVYAEGLDELGELVLSKIKKDC